VLILKFNGSFKPQNTTLNVMFWRDFHLLNYAPMPIVNFLGHGYSQMDKTEVYPIFEAETTKQKHSSLPRLSVQPCEAEKYAY
jgi:hypothetical protein